MGILNLGYLELVKKTTESYKKHIEYTNFENPDFDILILGNSLALDGFDTEYMSERGFSSYNLAIGGASIRTSIIQLQEYLDLYSHKPGIAIIGLGSFLDTFKSEQVHPVVDFSGKNWDYEIDDLPMLKFKWMFKGLLKKIVSPHHREARLVLGQLKFAKTIPDISKEDPDNPFLLERYTESLLIQELIDLCTEHNIRLYIVEMPGYKNTRHEKQFDYYIIDKESSNGILLDYNTFEFGRIFNDNTDWVGNSHLNVYGARKFTEAFLKQLKK
jgi:hypothetical protein